MLYQKEKQNFGQAFLDDIVEWVAQNLEPDEIYTGAHKMTLESWAREWAEENSYVEEG